MSNMEKTISRSKGHYANKTVAPNITAAQLISQDTLGGLYGRKEDPFQTIRLFGAGTVVSQRQFTPLEHPNILNPITYSDPGGHPQYLLLRESKTTLRDWLRKHRHIKVGAAVSIILQITSAIYAIHSKNRVHGALIPESIFIEGDPHGKLRIYVLDMPLRFSDKFLQHKFYMCPEQILGEGKPSKEWDTWSIGVIGYEILYGRRPFSGKNLDEISGKILLKDPVFSSPSVNVPGDLVLVIKKALEKESSNRYPNMTILGGDLLFIQETIEDELDEDAETVLRESISPSPRISVHPPVLKESEDISQVIETAVEKAFPKTGKIQLETVARKKAQSQQSAPPSNNALKSRDKKDEPIAHIGTEDITPKEAGIAPGISENTSLAFKDVHPVTHDKTMEGERGSRPSDAYATIKSASIIELLASHKRISISVSVFLFIGIVLSVIWLIGEDSSNTSQPSLPTDQSEEITPPLPASSPKTTGAKPESQRKTIPSSLSDTAFKAQVRDNGNADDVHIDKETDEQTDTEVQSNTGKAQHMEPPEETLSYQNDKESEASKSRSHKKRRSKKRKSRKPKQTEPIQNKKPSGGWASNPFGG